MTKNSGSPSIGYGSSEYAAQAWSELGNVIFLRHLLREAAKKGGLFLGNLSVMIRKKYGKTFCNTQF